jgi:transposase
MVHLVKKKIKGNTYLYLQETAWINGKSERVWQKYLGPESKVKENLDDLAKPEIKVSTLDFGLPCALMQLVKKLELIEIINDCTEKREQGLSVGNYMVLAAINRCAKPTTKAKIRRWIEQTALFRAFPPIETYFDSMAYTNHFKYLTPKIVEIIETRIHEKLITAFGISTNALFYDPTNFFTYINPKEGSSLVKHGHSKEGRKTLNLVGLTLFCTKDGGLPVMHEVYPGNVQDARLFREELPRLFERFKRIGIDAKELCVVFDKGNISENAFEQINASGIRFITSIRPSTRKDLIAVPSQEFALEKLPNGKEVGVREFPHAKYGSHRLMVVYNPRQRAWQEKNLRKKLEQRIVKVNEWFKNKLNAKKWRNPAAVETKIRSIIKIKDYFQWIKYSVSGVEGAVAYSIDIDKSGLDAHVNALGKSFLLSNHPTMSPLEITWMYRQQYTIEQAFKYLKSPAFLSVRPMYDHSDESVRGHLFTCVLGLLLLTLLTREIQQKYNKLSLPTIVKLLSEVQLVVIQYGKSHKTIKLFAEMSKESKDLSNFLHLETFM